jgi:hypothetical protein
MCALFVDYHLGAVTLDVSFLVAAAADLLGLGLSGSLARTSNVVGGRTLSRGGGVVRRAPLSGSGEPGRGIT